MHAPLAKPTKITADRASVARRAWRLWKLAQAVAARGPYDPTRFAKLRAAGVPHADAIDEQNADFRERREVSGISSFGDAMRAAWAGEKHRVETMRASAADAVSAVARTAALVEWRAALSDADVDRLCTEISRGEFSAEACRFADASHAMHAN